MKTPKNVLGNDLELCGTAPKTGYYRNGLCQTDSSDVGSHVICAQVTDTFLAFTKAAGNDLSSPAPHFGFPGLKPGDRWCLCALRWKEALEAGVAPPVILEATHESALRFVSFQDLKHHAVKET
jgi:uncharacterized protein (DUF2237 family)